MKRLHTERLCRVGYITQVLLVFTVIIIFAAPCHAQQPEPLTPEQKLYVAASTSAAAYDNSFAQAILQYLEQLGWRHQLVENSGHKLDMQYVHLVKEIDGVTYHIISFRGTENKLKDIQVDLQTNLIPFIGKEADSSQEETGRPPEKPANEPKVHKGFLRYAKAAWEQDFTTGLCRDLMNQDTGRQTRLIITGHSLGGAAASIYGAMLLKEGVSPDVFEVISFAAPAFCNDAFREKYQAMKLLRIKYTDDPIPKIIQKLGKGYCQMGEELQFSDKLDPACDEHQMSVYLDFAMQQYYRLPQKEPVSQGDRTDGSQAEKPVLLIHRVKPLGGHDKRLVELFDAMLKTHYQPLQEYYEIVWEDAREQREQARFDYELFTSTEVVKPVTSTHKRYTTVVQELWSAKEHKLIRAAAFGKYYSSDMSQLQMFLYNLLKARESRFWLPEASEGNKE